MSNHFGVTSSLKNILGSTKSNVPSYNPSRVYNSRKRKAAPRRFSFDVTIYDNPGLSIMSRQLLKEKELSKIGVGNILLYDNQNVEEVKQEMMKLVMSLTEGGIEEENIDFIYLKRESRKRQFRRHYCSNSFVYDALGIKDMTGRDSKNVYAILSKILAINTVPPKSVVSLIDNDDDMTDSELQSPFSSTSTSYTRHVISSPPTSYKRSISSCVSTNGFDIGHMMPKTVETPIKSGSKETLMKILEKSIGKQSEVYKAEKKYETLIGVIIILRQLTSFMESIKAAIDEKAQNATELEHSLAQILLLFEDSNLSGWNIALGELASILLINETSPCCEVFLHLTKALRDLDCQIWNDFFLDACLSSDLNSEFCGSNGFQEISQQNIDCLTFNCNDGDSLIALFSSLTARTEVLTLPEGLTINGDGGTLLVRKYFKKLPEILFCGIRWNSSAERTIVITEKIQKVILEDIRSFNKDIYYLNGFVCCNEDEHVIVTRYSDKDIWRFNVNGDTYKLNVPSITSFISKNLSDYQTVFLMYSSVLHLGDNSILISKNAGFLRERLIAKQNLNHSDVMIIADDSRQGDYELLLCKLEGRLNLIHGQSELKSCIKKWARHMIMERHKSDLGATTQSKLEILSTLHMVLMGNPGTGKTTIARCMAGILYDIGLLKSSEVIEVQRSDLVSSYIGDTARKTEDIVKKAFGKMVFIDEAYTLSSKSEKDFGKEAVETIMRYMIHDISSKAQLPVFAFAGYEDPMEEFLNLNRGLRRRIKQKFKFEDYSPIDLGNIFINKLIKNKMRFPYGVEPMIVQCFSDIPKKVRADYNASLCEDLLNEVRYQQEERLTFNATLNELMRFTKEDFAAATKILIDKLSVDKGVKKINKATQTIFEVELHIPGVGIIPGSPLC